MQLRVKGALDILTVSELHSRFCWMIYHLLNARNLSASAQNNTPTPPKQM